MNLELILARRGGSLARKGRDAEATGGYVTATGRIRAGGVVVAWRTDVYTRQKRKPKEKKTEGDTGWREGRYQRKTGDSQIAKLVWRWRAAAY